MAPPKKEMPNAYIITLKDKITLGAAKVRGMRNHLNNPDNMIEDPDFEEWLKDAEKGMVRARYAYKCFLEEMKKVENTDADRFKFGKKAHTYLLEAEGELALVSMIYANYCHFNAPLLTKDPIELVIEQMRG